MFIAVRVGVGSGGGFHFCSGFLMVGGGLSL